MKQQYHVKLSDADRKVLKKHMQSKKYSLESKKRASVLLDLDEGASIHPLPVKTIAARNGVSEGSVRKYRKQFATDGLNNTVMRKKRETPPVASKITGEAEAHIIAVCCSAPPEGKSQWSMQMIANRVVLDGVVESISDETVRRVLKKLRLNHT
jgi:transposase